VQEHEERRDEGRHDRHREGQHQIGAGKLAVDPERPALRKLHEGQGEQQHPGANQVPGRLEPAQRVRPAREPGRQRQRGQADQQVGHAHGKDEVGRQRPGPPLVDGTERRDAQRVDADERCGGNPTGERAEQRAQVAADESQKHERRGQDGAARDHQQRTRKIGTAQRQPRGCEQPAQQKGEERDPGGAELASAHRVAQLQRKPADHEQRERVSERREGHPRSA
jgi:hypothetical protein